MCRPARVVGSLLATVALAGSSGCAGSHHRAPSSSAPAPPAAGSARAAGSAPAVGSASRADGPAVGLTEGNAQLLWNPAGGAGAPGAFQTARRALTALHPTYLRLLVDWAALQPDPRRPPALEAPTSGCARSIGPCGEYAGIGAALDAIASQQRAAGSGGGFRVVLDIFGAPTWAAHAPSGCEQAGTTAFARPLRPVALAAYRSLVASLLELGARKGVPLEWWSPWNEPNDPRFLSPQHPSCDAASPPAAPALYAQLARAMATELRAAGGHHELLLGELNDFERDTPRTTSIASFVAGLPDDVICLAGAWSVHAYARHTPASPATEPVAALESALDARGPCGRQARVWITEAGAGAPHPGRPRPAGTADQVAGCLALGEQLRRWHSDPRVGAVFQYSFREDPAFPVGLVSADLAHLYPTYGLWLSWSQLRAAGEPPPAPGPACAAAPHNPGAI